MDPLILTLRLDDDSFARLDALRRRHFPPERNHIPAHVTLFHALPGDRQADILDHLAGVVARQAPIPIEATEVMSLGRGVAIRLEVPGLKSLRARVAAPFEDDLTAQDQQGPRPHVTVQNKVDKDTAAATLQEVRDGFTPWAGTATGLLLWHYRGGPWDHAATLPFAGDPA